MERELRIIDGSFIPLGLLFRPELTFPKKYGIGRDLPKMALFVRRGNHPTPENNKEIFIMKTNRITTCLLAASLTVFFVLPAHAHAARHPRRKEVNGRAENQQDRIAQGVKSGALTPGETASLEKQEGAIKRQERQDVKANGGYLTKQETHQFNQEQNAVSRQIYQDKHNDNSRPAHPTSEVGQRERNQQGRIAQGIKNGTLSPGEASQLEQGEKNIHREIKTDRAANGGKLTSDEKKQINQQQNAESKQIYTDKHNEGGSVGGTTTSSTGSTP